MLKMKSRRSAAGLVCLGAVALGFVARSAFSSDHADTPQIAAAPGTDLSDVFLFPSPTDSTKVVLGLCVSPLITPGEGRYFDPNVLYQFKIDNTGDGVEDLVIQARFSGSGASQTVSIAGPAAPIITGTENKQLSTYSVTGTFNTEFSPATGIKVFAGKREDPFFFDLEQFFKILPDRQTPLKADALPAGQDPNAPQSTTFRAPGAAKDFLAGYNVLSIVVELPKSMLRGTANGKIAVWCTTSK